MDRSTDIYSKIAACLLDQLYDCVEAESKLFDLDSSLSLQLLELNVGDRGFMLRNANKYLSLQVDSNAITALLQERLTLTEEVERENQFLLLQAPQQLMRDLFGMHTSTFSWRRQLLGLYGQGKHRPFSCDRKTEMMVWQLWHKYQHLDERKRYLKVAELSNLSISIISAAIKRYSKAMLD